MKKPDKIYFVIILIVGMILGGLLLIQAPLYANPEPSPQVNHSSVIPGIGVSTWAYSIYFIIAMIVVFMLIYLYILKTQEKHLQHMKALSEKIHMGYEKSANDLFTHFPANDKNRVQNEKYFVDLRQIERFPNVSHPTPSLLYDIEIQGKILEKDILFENRSDQQLKPEPDVNPLIEKARKIVLENIDNSKYNIDDFCLDLGMSRMQLYRKFKAVSDISANTFIRKVRLEKAAELIKTKKYSIKEVTYDVGFSDPKYFRKCFFDEFGVNPSRYITNI